MNLPLSTPALFVIWIGFSLTFFAFVYCCLFTQFLRSVYALNKQYQGIYKQTESEILALTKYFNQLNPQKKIEALLLSDIESRMTAFEYLDSRLKEAKIIEPLTGKRLFSWPNINNQQHQEIENLYSKLLGKIQTINHTDLDDSFFEEGK